MRTRLLLPLLLLALAAPAAAQTVAGEFVDAAGAAIPFARVTLHTSEGGPALRSALTDAQGRFTLQAPAPGRYVVRGERLGYLLTESGPLDLAEGERKEQRLVAGEERVRLDAVLVSAGARCTGRGTTEETAVVWEEARKALGVVSATWAGRRAQYTVERFEREVEPVSGAVRREQRTVLAGTSEKPFTPVDPARLSAGGYIEARGDTLVYHAPDADVLLSDPFLEDHCFRLTTANAPAAGLVGLAFEPVRGRPVPDVEGVLWLDRSSGELREMEWRYTRAPIPGPRGVPGGRMEFRRLPDGRWITLAWVLRMPEEGRATAAAYGTGARRQLATIRETGGTVTSVDGAP